MYRLLEQDGGPLSSGERVLLLARVRALERKGQATGMKGSSRAEMRLMRDEAQLRSLALEKAPSPELS